MATPAAIRDGDAGANCAACSAAWHSAPHRGAPIAGLLDTSTPAGRSIPVVPPPRGQVYPRSGPVIQRASAASTDEQGAEESVSATLVVTAAYPDYFYGQSADGFWGVRVNYPGHGFVEDEKVSIRGMAVFSEEGELTIEATAGSAQGMQPLAPVFLSNRAVAGSASPVLPFGRYSHPPVEGGAGLGTPGVLLRTGGVVTAVSPDGTAMTISDGSAWGGLGMHDAEGNEGIRVFVPDGPPPPAGTYVQVKGVGSYYQAGGRNYASVKVPAGALVDWLKLRSIRVHFIRVSDDDGSRTADITPLQAADWVARANAVLGQAGIAFLYDPDNDFTDYKSTLLNNMSGNGDADWKQSSGLANSLASWFYKGKMVVFVRQAAGGFSWWDLNFVAMPAYNTYHCGSLNTSLFSHEIGHYLGLWHTFPADPFPSVSAAEQYFINN